MCACFSFEDMLPVGCGLCPLPGVCFWPILPKPIGSAGQCLWSVSRDVYDTYGHREPPGRSGQLPSLSGRALLNWTLGIGYINRLSFEAETVLNGASNNSPRGYVVQNKAGGHDTYVHNKGACDRGDEMEHIK